MPYNTGYAPQGGDMQRDLITQALIDVQSPPPRSQMPTGAPGLDTSSMMAPPMPGMGAAPGVQQPMGGATTPQMPGVAPMTSAPPAPQMPGAPSIAQQPLGAQPSQPGMTMPGMQRGY